MASTVESTVQPVGIPFSLGGLGFLDQPGELTTNEFNRIISRYDEEFKKYYGEYASVSRFRDSLDPNKENRFFDLKLSQLPSVQREYRERLQHFCELGLHYLRSLGKKPNPELN